ncbi:uncharacterized protein LOC132718496 [Ruditapes philippinarum]|uniref:uncharacterized protein LOC132718496 n=1 Tax=Ruditapes philippinarum TaxID=129788 RepID=UPI00295ADE88|nr:uncharacterized protein LOC132718496 [Ruditapes philippinarum]
MQHPAFSMIMGSPMSFPGFSMHDSSRSETMAECITDDIVCPAWCLMEDDWGCKYCPCGPANGMSPPTISEHRQTKPRHDEDCIGTLLCMLSCKEGYKLGPRDSEHGCQSCTCVKKNETKTDNSMSSYNTGSNNTGSHTSNQPCAWPLCMNGNGPNNGPGSGASMTSLPIGGVKAGGSLPGVDCIGAACSAKNGMQMMNHGSLPITPSIPQPLPISTPSPWRPTTKRSLATVPPKKTLLLMSPTKPTRHLYLVPLPTEVPKRTCSSLEYCMNNCHHGFQVQNSRNECPDCTCILRKNIEKYFVSL